MSEASDKILESTSKGLPKKALLVLEDGSVYEGISCGAEGEVFGEICFNTSLEGYLEIITDPSYAGQIVVMTYPQIGNYGVHLDDIQRAKPALSGLVVRDLCKTPSNWRSTMRLDEYLVKEGVVAIEQIDTRSLVRKIRDFGAMRAGISTHEKDPLVLLEAVRATLPLSETNYVSQVSDPQGIEVHGIPRSLAFAYSPEQTRRFRVAAYDCGAKNAILMNLERMGIEVVPMPWDQSAEEVLEGGFDGVFLSNGPGDPDRLEETYSQVEKLLGALPVFGICLGHQMVCKAAGGTIEKLKFGHHGGNHPVMNMLSGKVEITAQNHGFGVRFETLGPLIPELSGGCTEHPVDLRDWCARGVAPVVNNERFGRIRLSHVNLNDGTPEGIQFLDIPAFCVQYHPEAGPGPTDSQYLFKAFYNLMAGDPDYLDIDIAQNRLEGWNFASASVRVAEEVV